MRFTFGMYFELYVTSQFDNKMQAICDSRNYVKLFLYLSRFHTAFLEPDSNNLYYLKLQRDEIDNPHKPKSWSELGGTYPENFQIEIFLSAPLQKERY